MLPQSPRSPKASRREQSRRLRFSSLFALCVLFLALSSSLLALTSPRFDQIRKSPLSFSSYREAFAAGRVSAGLSARALSPLPMAGATWFSQGSLDPGLLTSWNSLPGGGGINPPNFTSGDIFEIQNTHNMSTTGAWTVSGTGGTIQIDNGGTLTANNIVAAPVFQVANGGTYIHNAVSGSANGAAGDIPGSTSRSFGASSTVEFQKWANGGTSPVALPNVSWGNLKINVATLAGSWNQTGNLQTVNGSLTVLATGGSTREFRLIANSPATTTLAIAGDVTVSGGILNLSSGSAAPTINLTGNLSLSGSGTFETTGAGIATVNIGGNYNQTGGTFTTSGGSNHSINFTGGTPSATFSATGSFTNTNINWQVANGKTVQWNTAVGIATSRNLTIASGGTFILAASGSFTVNGTVTVNGEFRIGLSGAIVSGGPVAFSYGTNGTLSFNTASSYGVLPGVTYWPTSNSPKNVTVMGAGITLNGAMSSIPNTLTLTAGNVTNANNLTLGNGATISREAGSLSGTPTFGTTVNVTYTGSTPVTTGTEIPSSSSVLQNLTFSNVGGVTLGTDATVNATLALSFGTVTTGANTLIHSGSGLSLTPGSYVIGNLRKIFSSAGTSSYTFAVGTANGYSPVDANVTVDTAGNNTLTLKAVQGGHANISGANKLQRYWTLSNSFVGTGSADLTFNYLAGDVSGTESNYKIIKVASGGALTQFTPNTLNTTSHFATLNGVSSFSDWTLAEPAAIQYGTLEFSSGTYSDSETAGTTTITVNRTGGSDSTVSVDYATIAGGTATSGAVCLGAPTFTDYLTNSGTLSFNAGETSKTFTVTLCNDIAYEPNDTVNLQVSNAQGGATLGSQTSAVLTITSNDAAPTIGILDVTAAEGNSGTTNFSFNIFRSGSPSQDPINIAYHTANGSAIAPGDYTAVVSGNTSIASFGPSVNVVISVNGDTTIESDETFTVELDSTSVGSFSDTSGLGTITNDDVASPGDVAVAINGSNIAKLKGTDGSVLWNVAVANDSALAVDQSDFGVYTGKGGAGSGTGATYKYSAGGALAWTNSVTTGTGFCSFYYVNGAAVDTTSGTPGVVFTEGSCGGAMAKANRTTGAQLWSITTNDIGRPSIDPANGQIYASTYLGPFNKLYSVTTGGSATTTTLCQGITDLNPADGMLYLGGNMGVGGCGLQLSQLNKSALATPNWTMSLAGVVTSFDTLAVQPWTGGYIYAGSNNDSKIVVIDPATQTVAKVFSTAVPPASIAVSPDGGTIYIGYSATGFNNVYAYSPQGALLWTSPNLGGPIYALASPRDLVGTAPATGSKYRSRANGNWNDFNTWDIDTGSGFVPASSGQTPTSADDTITIQSGHTVTVTANVSVDQVTVNSGGVLTVNGGVTVTLDDGYFDDVIVAGALNATGILAGAGSVGITSGTATLSNNNTFTGGVTLSSGTLNLNNAGALGTGTFRINGGTIDNTSGGSLTLTNSVTRIVNANFTFTGSNNLNLGTAGVSLGTAAGTSRTVTVSGGTLTIGGAIANGTTANALTKAGAGTLTLTGANTYTGATTISAGTLTLSGTASLASNTITTAGGATFDVSSHTGTVTLSTSQTLNGTGTSSTGTINGNLTMGSTSPLTLSYASGNPTLTASNGALTLAAGNPVTVTTTSALSAGDYVLISKSSGGSVAGTAPTSVTVGGSGLAANTTAALRITGQQLILQVRNLSGDIAVNIAGTTVLKLNGADGTVAWSVAQANDGALAIDQSDFGVYTGKGGAGSGTGATYKYSAFGSLAWSNTVTTGTGFCSFYYVNGAAVDTTSGTPGVVFTEGSCGGAMAKANRTTGAQLWSITTNDIGRPSIDPANGQIYASTYLGPFNKLYSVTTGGSASTTTLCQGNTDLNPADGMLYLGGNMGVGGCGLQLSQLNKSALATPNWTMSLAGVVTSFDTLAVQPWTGGYIYAGSVSSSKIVVIDPATQSIVRTFTPLVAPAYLAANPNGTLYIANGANNFAYAYSPTGTLLWTSSNLGGVVNGLATPRNLVGTAPATIKYRSVASGNWNAASTWESSTDGGSSWFAATDVPAADSDPIEIQSGHTVTVTADTFTDQLTVDLGATLIINSGVTLTINNGPGTDFNNIGTTTVNGTLINNGLITNSSPFNANGTFQINNGGSFSGNTPVYGGSSTLVYNTPSGYTVGNEWTGNASTAGAGTPQNVTVQSGPSGTVQLPGTDRALAGNLTITSGTLALSTTANIILTVNGNLTLTSGSVTVGAAILTLNGDTSVASGTLSAATGTVNYFGSGTQHVIAADYFLLAFASGGKILPSSGTVGILDTFNPGGTSGHTITGSTIDFKKATNQSIPAFSYNNLSNSGNGARTYPNGGTVRIAGTFSYGNGGPHTVTGNTIEMNGTSAQTLPNQGFTFNNLTINNAAGVTAGTTGSPVNVNGTLALMSGALNNGVGNNLTMANGATIDRSGGSIAAAPIFGTSVNVIYSGAGTATTGPEIPSSTSVLNNLTINKSGGVTLGANAQCNGLLTLTNDLTVPTGFTLTQSGTSAGPGDVVGKVHRDDLGGTMRTFGNPFVQITMTVGTITSMDVTLNKGVAPGGFASAVLRTYLIEPAAGVLGAATLRLHYLDSELNGNNETILTLWRATGSPSATWQNQIATSRDTTDNWVELIGVTGFSPWTMAATPAAPTAVRLSKFDAASYRDGVQLGWETGFEVDNLGYQIYRERNGQRELVTPGVVAGSALKVGPRNQLRAGYAYSWFDDQGRPDTTYYLESIDLNGERTLTGPIYPQRGMGQSPHAQKRAALLGEINAGADVDSARFEQSAPASIAKSDNPSSSELLSSGAASGPQPPVSQITLPNMAAVKISVSRSGWYRVMQSELVAAGLDANSDARRLQLFVDNQEIPMVVNANGGRFAAGDSIEFYGQALDTLSTDTHVYWLINGSSSGKRITRPKAPKPNNQDWTPLVGGSFGMNVTRADKLIYFSSLLNGEASNIFGPAITSNPATQSLTVNNLDPSSTQAQLSVTLQGVNDVAHEVQVQLNGSPVGTVSFTGRQHPVQSFTVSRALLHEGTNTVTLSGAGGGPDVSLVDSVSLTYAHSYRADNNALRFSVAAGQTIIVSGFTSAAIRVIDITNPAAPIENAPQISAMNGGYAFKLQTSGAGTRTFMALTDDLASHPAALLANQPANLTALPAADLLIVTHHDFRAAVEPLAAQRRGEGLTVAVVDIEDVYDEFSFGAHSPNALRDFLAYTNSHGTRPRYLLLVGDSSWDPRNSLQQGFGDFIPTKLIDTVYLETASDDWLSDFDGDGIADVATGRLPVRTAAEATLMVNKLLAYEQERQNAAPLRGALLVSDSGFESESSATAALLPSGMSVTTINRADVGSDDLMRTQIVNNLNTGPLVANYFGHGSVTVWTGAGLLDSDLATSLTNDNRPTLFVLMTCLNGYSHDAYIDSLGESLLKAPQGGAMAVWASSGFTESDPQFAMSSQFYRSLFSSTNVRLGDAFKPAKATISDPDVQRTWLLLGDPSMRLR
jgi:autotransporter-associated beta strand protein